MKLFELCVAHILVVQRKLIKAIHNKITSSEKMKPYTLHVQQKVKWKVEQTSLSTHLLCAQVWDVRQLNPTHGYLVIITSAYSSLRLSLDNNDILEFNYSL